MKSRLGITAGVAAVLIGGGIALGIAFAGGSSPAGHGTPTVVSPADQIVTISSSDTASTPIDTVTVTSAAPLPAPATTTEAAVASPKPAPTTSKTPARESLVVQGPGTTGDDGVLRPPAPTYTSTPCETPTDYAPGTKLDNPCPS